MFRVSFLIGILIALASNISTTQASDWKSNEEALTSKDQERVDEYLSYKQNLEKPIARLITKSAQNTMFSKKYGRSSTHSFDYWVPGAMDESFRFTDRQGNNHSLAFKSFFKGEYINSEPGFFGKEDVWNFQTKWVITIDDISKYSSPKHAEDFSYKKLSHWMSGQRFGVFRIHVRYPTDSRFYHITVYQQPTTEELALIKQFEH